MKKKPYTTKNTVWFSVSERTEKPRRAGKTIRIKWKRFLPFLCFLAVFIVSSVMLANYIADSVHRKRENRALQAEYYDSSAQEATPSDTAAEPSPAPQQAQKKTLPELLDSYQYIGTQIQPSAKSMYKKNPDFIAWLSIPGVVSLPVVYRDNSHYLSHDFSGDRSDAGTLFLDALHPFREDTQYMVIHGHNMYDGSMFGLLSHYRNSDYAREHPYVYFNTLYRDETYKVVTVMIVSPNPGDSDYVAYTGKRKFFTVERFYEFVESIAAQAKYWVDGEAFAPEDSILALSTCFGDERIVLICKRILP